jgi:elongation factor P
MNEQTYEQVELPAQMVEDFAPYMKEGQQVYVMLHDGKPLAIRPPASVRLEVVEAEDAVKGDTATNAKKPVKVESGATVNVPIFIKKGDMIVINPEDGSYIERSN